jgi:hypothetical protein
MVNPKFCTVYLGKSSRRDTFSIGTVEIEEATESYDVRNQRAVHRHQGHLVRRGWHEPEEVAQAITGLGPGRRAFGDAVFASLCCETGDAAFRRAFSSELRTTFVGPRDTVHSFEAAGLVHRLFYELFLGGETFAQALKRTRSATENFRTTFRCWLNGVEAA